MPTRITLCGDDNTITVKEEPNAVADALTRADGNPVALTLNHNDDPVYVNPANVAAWSLAHLGVATFS